MPVENANAEQPQLGGLASGFGSLRRLTNTSASPPFNDRLAAPFTEQALYQGQHKAHRA
jgi:hypothetical protein